ncbi:glutamine synthetase family protein [Oceanicella actignis]|uniref:Glutamine synthetase n=1 Tax=Oceanicella actignis TaxID=1189325 RepID=A0A1M7T6A9_9RHOB|nr:glutamine synthetase family protein [Oceanicella actignis]SET44614.1 glutamine synthetase [Oceanicella actignis]SHN66274.1 glutamine synthetase [Oceanicella actignis]
MTCQTTSLAEALLNADPDAPPPQTLPEGAHTVAVGVADLNGVLRGKRVSASHWPSVARRGIALDNTFFSMDVTSQLTPNSYSGPESGYPDLFVIPRGPLRPIPWEEGVWMTLGRAQDHLGNPVPIDPRQPLLRAVARARAMGFEVQIGAELEFYLLDPATRRPREKRMECYGLARAAELEPVLGPIRRHLEAMGVPIEQSNPEFAPGQVEVNLRYGPALAAADHAALLRGMVKQLARQHGLIASFMAKPFIEHSGSGFHMHHSLWRDGRNAFAEDGRLNALGRAYLAGLQRHMAQMSLVGSTTPNAYRRRKPYTYCPVNASWAVDNRTVGLRVIEGADAAVRIEKRDGAADANPYLLMAAEIEAGLRGIEMGWEPEPPSAGDAYAEARHDPLPASIAEALRLAHGSTFLREALGEQMLELLITQAERELAKVEEQVTPVEIERYLEAM